MRKFSSFSNTMTPASFLFSLVYLLCGATAKQAKTVNIGDSLTLQCPYDREVFKYYWFKQNPGEIPRLISVTYRGYDDGVFEEEFKKERRFKMNIQDAKINLEISRVQPSDSATYLCAGGYSSVFQFVSSITVFVKALNIQAEVHQSSPEKMDEGNSITLNCTVHTGSCDGAHRVSWFKKTEDSHAGVLYSHGGSSDQCGRNTDSQSNSCVYNLPIHNVSSEQTGTYYCAVASCGQVLFGNGTTLCVQATPVFVSVLCGALVLTSSLVVALTLCLCVKNNTEPRTRRLAPSKNGFPKLLQYMATEQVRRGPLDETWSECVYFSVEQ